MNLPKVKTAGVLPYAVNARGDISFLLGKEAYEPNWRESDKWSHFGGAIEKEEGVLEGAAREGYEETAGVVFMLPEMQQKLKSGEFRMVIDVIYKKTRFMCFFVQVPYLDYPLMFRNTKAFVQYTGGSVKCIEKNQLKWFTFGELRQHLLKLPKNYHNGTNTAYKSFYGRRPVFRRKFAETMRYFFRINGELFLKSRVNHGVAQQALHFYHHVEEDDVHHHHHSKKDDEDNNNAAAAD